MKVWQCQEKNCSGCILTTPNNSSNDDGWQKDYLDGQLCGCSKWELLSEQEKKNILKPILGLES